jgi:hypothetical protein
MYFSRQPVATDGNGFGLLSALPRPSDLPLIATSCNHGAPERLHPAGPRIGRAARSGFVVDSVRDGA